LTDNKIVDIKITQDFIAQREERAKIYNARGRSEEQLRLDIECEVFEWWMISQGTWDDDDRWEIDGVCPIYGNVDVKFVKKWYNLSCQKLIYLLRQRDITEHFLFCEWVKRPERLLEDGDIVAVNVLGAIPYWDLVNALRTSKYNGYYVDVKRLLQE
jgi:hypothetical protein